MGLPHCPSAACARASSSPGPLPPSQQPAQRGSPWGARSQPRAGRASDPTRATAAPRPSLLTSPVQPCRGGSTRRAATGSAPAERAGQSVELCRAAGCREPASHHDTLHAPLRCQHARPLGQSQGTETTAALPHHRAGIWHCRHCPAHLALHTRTESPPGSRGCPVPWDHSSPQDGDAGSANLLPLPATCCAPTRLCHGSQCQGTVQGSSAPSRAQCWLTWQCEMPRTKARLPQTAGRAPPLHVPAVPWPNGCARAGGVRGNASPRRCAESGNSRQRSATEKGAGWTGEPSLPDSLSPHLQARAPGLPWAGWAPHSRAAVGLVSGYTGQDLLREAVTAGDKAAGETLGSQ